MGPVGKTPNPATGRQLVQPLGGLLAAIAVVTLFLLAVGLAGTLSGSGMALSYPGLGTGPVCADVNYNGIGMVSSSLTLTGLRPGASVGVPNPIPLCLQHATAGQRALAFLASAPHTVLYLMIFGLTGWLLLVARREGPFVPTVCRLLRFLGWLVLVGSVIVAIGQNLAQAYFLATATASPVPVAADALNGAFLGVPLLAGCALLTLARIMRAGSRMRDDLEGTVLCRASGPQIPPTTTWTRRGSRSTSTSCSPRGG